jgi:hypothetical protein
MRSHYMKGSVYSLGIRSKGGVHVASYPTIGAAKEEATTGSILILFNLQGS